MTAWLPAPTLIPEVLQNSTQFIHQRCQCYSKLGVKYDWVLTSGAAGKPEATPEAAEIWEVKIADIADFSSFDADKDNLTCQQV